MFKFIAGFLLISSVFIIPFVWLTKRGSKSWGKIADKFEARIPVPKRFDFKGVLITILDKASVDVGKIAMLEDGLYLAIGFPSAMYDFKRPLLIPWSEIQINWNNVFGSGIFIKSLEIEVNLAPIVISTIEEYMKYNVKEEN
jgi:hypothetical protein